MTRPSTDTLSPTLPSRTRSRSKWRKPRKPTFMEIWCLCWTAVSAIFAVTNLLGGHPINGAYFAGCTGCWWRGYHRARRGATFALTLPSVAFVCGVGLTLAILGVNG